MAFINVLLLSFKLYYYQKIINYLCRLNICEQNLSVAFENPYVEFTIH